MSTNPVSLTGKPLPLAHEPFTCCSGRRYAIAAAIDACTCAAVGGVKARARVDPAIDAPEAIALPVPRTASALRHRLLARGPSPALIRRLRGVADSAIS